MTAAVGRKMLAEFTGTVLAVIVYPDRSGRGQVEEPAQPAG
jgi:hypothetical protein